MSLLVWLCVLLGTGSDNKLKNKLLVTITILLYYTQTKAGDKKCCHWCLIKQRSCIICSILSGYAQYLCSQTYTISYSYNTRASVHLLGGWWCCLKLWDLIWEKRPLVLNCKWYQQAILTGFLYGHNFWTSFFPLLKCIKTNSPQVQFPQIMPAQSLKSHIISSVVPPHWQENANLSVSPSFCSLMYRSCAGRPSPTSLIRRLRFRRHLWCNTLRSSI